MRADTLLNVASVTKTFTAALLLQLVEQGRCQLDDPAERHLPFALRHPAGHAPTLRQLLTHSASIADPAAYAASYVCGDPRQPMGHWLQAQFGAASLFHAEPPGSRHSYSNVGYGLLGFIVERLGGRSFEAQCRRAWLSPLGMHDSRVMLAGLPRHRHATPHEFIAADQQPREPRLVQGQPLPVGDGARQQPLCLYSFATISDGLLRSSAAELARGLQALLAGGILEGRRVLQAATVAQMFSDQAPHLNPRGYRQGLAWRGLGDGVWAHFGSDPGVAAAVALRPRDGRGMALLANGSRARPLLGALVTEWMAL
jgi:CubicO group peptidase (beta-lactamase class C family)